MKNIVIILLSILTLQAYAQKRTPSEKAKAKTDEMQHDLALSPEQNKKIYELNLKTYNSIANYEAKQTNERLRKKQKDVETDIRKAEFKKVLTASQFKKYEELRLAEKELKKQKKNELEKIK
ncbi:MAG: hypothetical protein IT215_00610 [Chitinophagaceae bacterium]|nr:MAG: hypothetical protein UZ11_BCD004000566 [Bacteroidetes bacterium OLB11]MCC6447171.1 hypothetical protein [Chitinophagaceae bacterium]HMN31998.1 hypothetical protein [Chitinophagaceae bacterium]